MQSSSELGRGEREESRELGGWRRRLQQPRAGTHLPVCTPTHTHTGLTLETALTHEHGVMCDVIWIWCVSSLGQTKTQIVGFGRGNRGRIQRKKPRLKLDLICQLQNLQSKERERLVALFKTMYAKIKSGAVGKKAEKGVSEERC